jgi:hypothetical protein
MRREPGADFAQLARVRRRALALVFGTLVTTAGLASCGGPDKQLQDAQKNIRGLDATVHAVAEAWLNGDVSATYSRTAFQQTLQLLDKQRASLDSSPKLLLDPRGASLSRDAERLSRALAALIDAARRNDAGSARQQLRQLPAGNSP